MDRLYFETVTIPAHTLPTAPVDVALPLEDAQLKQVTVVVPDGHNGLTGIRVLWSGQQVIPWGNNSFIVANGRTIPIDFNDYITVSGLVFEGFNTDIFPHSFYFELTVTDDLSRSALLNTPPGKPAVVA